MTYEHEKEFEVDSEVTIFGYPSHKANVKEERTEYFTDMLVKVSDSGRVRFEYASEGEPYKTYSWGVIYDVSDPEIHEWLDSIGAISSE